MNLPKKGIYRHFKGNRYELQGFARHSETLETMVIYRALYGEYGLWVRPLSMWSEEIERDGEHYIRFMPEEEYLNQQLKKTPDHPQMNTESEGGGTATSEE